MVSPHNTERQAVMKRDREIHAAAQSRGNQATARSTSTKAAVTVPKQKAKSAPKRKRDDDEDRTPRKKVSLKDAQEVAMIRARYHEPKGPRKSKRIAEKAAGLTGPQPQGQSIRAENDSGLSSTSTLSAAQPDASAMLGSQAANTQGETAEESGSRRIPSTDQRANATQERRQKFLETLATNVSSYKRLRLLTLGYDQVVKRIDKWKYAKGGLVDLDERIRWRTEIGVSDPIFDQRARIKRELEAFEHEERTLKKAKWDLEEKHGNCTKRIYDFIDVTRSEIDLQCLPEEFWDSFDRCREAYTALKDVELEIQAVEQEQNQIFQEMDTRIVDAVCRNAFAPTDEATVPQAVAFGESIEVAGKRISAINGCAMRLDRLGDSLEDAEDARYMEENKLHEIAEAAFVASGFLSVDRDGDNRKLQWPSPGAADYDHDFRRERPQTERERMTAADEDKNREVAARVAHARKNLKDCRHRLEEGRFKPLSDAGSMDSNARGEAQFLRMNRRTKELRTAEAEYESVLHHAQNSGAISEADQSSNFQDHKSDGYKSATIRRYGYPMPKRKASGVNEWMDGIGKSRKRQPVRKDAECNVGSEKSGDWVGRVHSMSFGEDVETRDDTRLKTVIEDWRRQCDLIREAGPFEQAENDGHPRNNPALPA